MEVYLDPERCCSYWCSCLIIVALSILGLIYLDLITPRPNPDPPSGNVMYSLVMSYIMYLLIDATVSLIE